MMAKSKGKKPNLPPKELLWLFGIAAIAVLYMGVKFSSITGQLEDLQTDVEAMHKIVTSPPEPILPDPPEVQSDPAFKPRSWKEAADAFAKLGKNPSAEMMAGALVQIDSWMIRVEDEASVKNLKTYISKRLRKRIKTEVQALQAGALKATTTREGMVMHAEAGRIVALYPMTNEAGIIAQAKLLMQSQVDIAGRLQLIRRQRYNLWAAQQIEKAIKGFNEQSSFLSPKEENPKIIASLLEHLGPIDPSVLEPVVMDMYHYVLDLTKKNISEADKISLMKKLADPANQRKTPGDF